MLSFGMRGNSEAFSVRIRHVTPWGHRFGVLLSLPCKVVETLAITQGTLGIKGPLCADLDVGQIGDDQATVSWSLGR